MTRRTPPGGGVPPAQIAHAAATAAGLPTAYVHDKAKFDRVTSDAGKNIRLKDAEDSIQKAARILNEDGR